MSTISRLKVKNTKLTSQQKCSLTKMCHLINALVQLCNTIICQISRISVLMMLVVQRITSTNGYKKLRMDASRISSLKIRFQTLLSYSLTRFTSKVHGASHLTKLSQAALLLVKGKKLTRHVSADFFITHIHIMKQFFLWSAVMERTGTYYYYYSKHLGAKMLRIPYSGRRYSMYIILPEGTNTLDNVISRLTAESVRNEVWHMDEVEVHTVLPKFKFDSSINLNEAVRKVNWLTCIKKTNY